MTRERKGKSLDEFLCEPCPYCKGKGKIKSHATMFEETRKHIMRYLSAHRKNRIEVLLHPELSEYIAKNHSRDVEELRRIYRTNIMIVKDPLLHFEDIRIQ